MVGNIKFSLIILVGYMIFRDPIRPEQIIAIALVMIGNFFKWMQNANMFLFYSIFKKKEYLAMGFAVLRKWSKKQI